MTWMMELNGGSSPAKVEPGEHNYLDLQRHHLVHDLHVTNDERGSGRWVPPGQRESQSWFPGVLRARHMCFYSADIHEQSLGPTPVQETLTAEFLILVLPLLRLNQCLPPPPPLRNPGQWWALKPTLHTRLVRGVSRELQPQG